MDAVLASDTDMEPYLFPNGTSQEEVQKVVDFDSNLDVTELPIAIQLTDWKSWLPEVHPKDLWPDGYFESENAGQEYAKIIEVLERVDISTLIQSGDIVSLLDAFQGAVKKWIAEGREDDDGGRGDKWRVYKGTVINNRESRFSREYTKVNLAKWMAVKYFEMMHEYRLEYQADLLVGKVDPIEGTRQWPNSDRTLFEIAPHFTSDDWSNFEWQSKIDGKYMSSAWYQLQMIVNPGEFNQGGNGGPMDWSYHFIHIYDMTDLGAPREGFRYFSSFLKLLQTRSNDFGLQHSGWRMRYVHPWWAFSDQFGDESSMNDLNVNDPDLRVKLYNALIQEWVEETRKYDLSTWPRKSDDWLAIDDASYVPSEDNINFSNGKLWKSSNQYHADFFYRLIPRLIALGVDCQTMDDLISWCNDAWPLGNWKQWHNGGCGSEDGMPHAVSNLKVVSDDCTGVTLSWTDESDSEKSFQVIRRDESGTLEQFDVAANVMVFEDNTVMEKHQYAYLVRTINEQGFQETLYEQIDIPSCMVTGVFSERDESLRVYPNPARNIVNVEGLKSGHNLQLFSVSGVMVWQGQSLGTRMEFSVDSYPSGFYLLQAQGESGIEIVRIIVQ